MQVERNWIQQLKSSNKKKFTWNNHEIINYSQGWGKEWLLLIVRLF